MGLDHALALKSAVVVKAGAVRADEGLGVPSDGVRGRCVRWKIRCPGELVHAGSSRRRLVWGAAGASGVSRGDTRQHPPPTQYHTP